MKSVASVMSKPPKERLQEYQWVVKNINMLEDRLLEAETDIQRMTQRFNDMPTGSMDNDKLTYKIDNIIEIKKEINEEVERKYEKIEMVHRMIEALDEREQTLIICRYIHGKRWVEICVDMNYEWRQVHYIHAKILKKLERLHKNAH